MLMVNKDIIHTPEYQFLWNEPKLKHLVLLGLGGSHAYGTDVPTSDIDIRGIAGNSATDILIGHDFEDYTNNVTDTVVYSLNKMFKLLANCNPNTIEILGLRSEQYLYMTSIGEELLKNADIFLSKRCVNTFGGYANQQLYRLNQKTLTVIDKTEYNQHTAKVLNKIAARFESAFGITSENLAARTDKNGDLVLDINLTGFPATSVSAILSELNQTIRDYCEPSKRNKKAETHNKIAKHSMHLIRLYLMCIDLLEKHEIITCREDEHDLLMSIRNGEFLDKDGRPSKDFFALVKEYESRWEQASKTTTLPDQPDQKAIDKLLCRFNMMIINDEF